MNSTLPGRAPAAAALLTLLIVSSGVAVGDAPQAVVQALEHVTLFVDDQDTALHWYVDQLGLVKVEDQRYGQNERWLTVAPPGTHATHIVLAVPREQMKSSIGRQHNWVFRTGDCRQAHRELSARGVRYVQEPTVLPWGCQAIIEDPFGNRIVLLGSAPQRERSAPEKERG